MNPKRLKADPAKWITTADIASAILFLAPDATKIHDAGLEVYGRSFVL